MKYQIANNYIETLERVTKQLFEMAYTERHPEPLTYEEIQALAYDVNTLDIMKLYREAYREAVNSDSLRLYKSMFSDILSNPHVVNGTARKRITILPYYPPGFTLVSDGGNNISISWKGGRVIGSETDSYGEEIAKHEIISYLFDGDMITKRLIKEGWEWENKFQSEEHKLLFYFSQLNQLQEAIFERWEDVRVMFDYIEKPNLKKYKRDFDTALLEKQKAKPEAWNAKPTILGGVVTYDEVDRTKGYYHKTGNTIAIDFRQIKWNKKKHNLLTFLSANGFTRGIGCIRPFVESDKNSILRKALEVGALSKISNGNRVDVLLCVFMTFAKKYIDEVDREKYLHSVKQQSTTFEKDIVTNETKIPKEIKKAISELIGLDT